MQLNFEHLQEWRFLRPSGHPVLVSDCVHCEKLFLYIQGNLEATFVCCILSFCEALLWGIWLLWRKVTLHHLYTLPLDPWSQQLDPHTQILLLNAGQTQLPQLHLLHHMLQPLSHPCILVVLCWNLSSLLISSFTGNTVLCLLPCTMWLGILDILTLIPGVQCRDTWATGRHWPWTSRAISLESSPSLPVT